MPLTVSQIRKTSKHESKALSFDMYRAIAPNFSELALKMAHSIYHSQILFKKDELFMRVNTPQTTGDEDAN